MEKSVSMASISNDKKQALLIECGTERLKSMFLELGRNWNSDWNLRTLSYTIPIH